MALCLASRSVPPSPSIAHSQVLLKALGLALTGAMRYPESKGHEVLWGLFRKVACLTHEPPNSLLRLLSYDVRLLGTDHGIVMYMVRDLQVHAMGMIPVAPGNEASLLQDFNNELNANFLDHGVDLRLLAATRQGCPQPQVSLRRFIPASRYLREMTLQGNTLACCGYEHAIDAVLTDMRALGEYKPASRISRDDPLDKRYWYRMPCGTVIVFTNPEVGLHVLSAEPLTLPLGSACDHIDCPDVKKIYRNMTTPPNREECLAGIASKCVPGFVRYEMVDAAIRTFGYSDDLIRATAEHVAVAMPPEHRIVLLEEMLLIARIMQLNKGISAPTKVLATVLAWLPMFQDTFRWRKWLHASVFVRTAVSKVPTEQLVQLVHKHPQLTYVAARDIEAHLPWTHAYLQRALKVVVEGPVVPSEYAYDSIRNVCAHVSLACSRQQGFLTELCDGAADSRALGSPAARAVPTKPLAKPPVPRKETARAAPTTTTDAADAPTEVHATHHALVQRMGARLFANEKFECELIGSGVFFADGDADVVIRVPAEYDRAAAYDTVQRCTQWTPCYDSVSDQHVAILCGTFEGVAVDAQVIRDVPCSAHTRAEKETAKALRLTRSLVQGTDASMRQCIATLHRFFTLANLKGHKLCRLPGIAISCTAALLSRDHASGSASDMALVDRFRDVLAEEFPHVDFDNGDFATGTQARPNCALQVVVQETNVATRLTVGTTRHMADICAYAVSAFTTMPVDSAAFRAWRVRTMRVCTRVAPKGDAARTLSMHLHSAVARLDGHPLIDSVYVEEEDDGGGGEITVRATLLREADVQRYGFSSRETIQRDGTLHQVRVSRDGTDGSWLLCAQLRSDVCGAVVGGIAEACSVASMIAVDAELCIPNAPHLTRDATHCFDARYWTCRV